MRLVSLTPSNTELVAFLGKADQLVGVDDWSDWPPSISSAKRVGPDLQIDLDAVVELEPDLVLASLSVPGMERVVAEVQRRGLKHLVFAPKTLSEVVADVTRVAHDLGAQAAGMRLAAAMDREIARIRSLTWGKERRRVYWEWWPKPTITTGSVGWMTAIIQAAGGVNVFGDRREESPKVSPKEVAAARPDVVCCCWCGALQGVQTDVRARERTGWEAVDALRGEVVLLPEALFGRPGPRLVEGLRTLVAELHPELRGRLGEPYAWVPADLKNSLPLAAPVT